MPPDRFAVIGDPIAHSLSPAMHNAALRAAGLPATYEAIHVPPEELGIVIERLRSTHRGFNVTIPHKEAILTFLDGLDAIGDRIGAANTVVILGGRLTGFNTDVSGFEAVMMNAEVKSGTRAVVFGAGGSARAVVFALARLGVSVTIVNRTVERGEALARGLGVPATVLGVEDAGLAEHIQPAGLLVNTTPMGMGHLPRATPLPENIDLSPETIAVDLVYGRPTPFLVRAGRSGCRTIDGIEMLVQQGALSFRLWTGVEPDRTLMRAAALKALEEMRSCSGS